MPRSLEPQLNRTAWLRYDTSHVSAVDADSFAESGQPVLSGREPMDVNGIPSVGRAAPIGQPRPSAPAGNVSPAAPQTPQDEVDISSAGRMLDDLARSGNVRGDRLTQIRQAIADGTYDTPEKFQAAVDRLLGHDPAGE